MAFIRRFRHSENMGDKNNTLIRVPGMKNYKF